MYRLFLFFLYLLVYVSSLYAGETSVTGKITDTESGEALFFVNIVFDDTTIGTVSDTAGVYHLQTSQSVDSIHFVTLGYHTSSFKVQAGVVNRIDVALTSSMIALDEVIARPDNSEAKRMIGKVIENKARNNPENLDSYSFRRYTQWKYRINNVPERMRKNRIFNNKEDIFGYDADGSRFLPVYSSEQVVFNEYQRNPLLLKSTIEADRTSGPSLLEETEISGFTAGMEYGFNFYENSIEILEHNFISPAANNGSFYYNYYLLDSIDLKNSKHYVLRFTPRRKGDNVFSGKMTIEDQYFSIVEVTAELTNTEHLNFIRELNIHSVYQLLSDSIAFFDRSEVTTVIDYMPVELKENQQRLELKAVNLMHFSDVEVNNESKVKLSHRRLSYESLKLNQYANRDESYWESVRPNAFTKEEKEFNQSIENLNKLPFVQMLDKIGQMTLTGYFNFGKWELGPYDYMLNYNKVEGTHLYLGGRTGSDLFNNFSVWGGVGYGTRNEKWLGRFGAGYILPMSRRTIVQMEYSDDIVLIGENEKILFLYENKQHTSESNLVSHFFKRAELDELYQRQRAKLSFQTELSSGINAGTHASWIRYFSPEFYPFTVTNNMPKAFNAAELTLDLRWSWEEKYMDYGFRRLYLGTSKPIVNLSLTGGHINIGDEQEFYGRIHTSFKHYLFVGQTRLDYAFEAGSILGTVPYPLLDIPRANITYGFQKYNFNMMNNLEFIHDKYLHTFIEYRLNGFVFKRTPLIKYLGLREVFSLKSMLGEVGVRHQRLLDFPTTLSSYNNDFYAEAGFGIENILRFFRLDAIWRVSPSDEAPRFGLRGRLEFKF